MSPHRGFFTIDLKGKSRSERARYHRCSMSLDLKTPWEEVLLRDSGSLFHMKCDLTKKECLKICFSMSIVQIMDNKSNLEALSSSNSFLIRAPK